MDNWLITHLEALFSRSRVSPYALARFFAVGTGLLALCVTAIDALTRAYVGAAIWLICSVLGACSRHSRAADAERENTRGFINSAKTAERKWRLIWWWMFLGFVIPLALTVHDRLSLAVTCWNTLVIAFEYVVCLNHTPPPPKTARSWLWRHAAGGVA